MKAIIFICTLLLCLTVSSSCNIHAVCAGYNNTSNICYQTTYITNATSTQYTLSFYGSTINSKFHYCPLQNTYCNGANFTNSSTAYAHCDNLLPNGAACIASTQCLGGLCTNAQCNTVQSSIGMKCSINTDCEYTLSCVKGSCQKPLQQNASCSYATMYGDYGLGLDSNECDYTKKLICGYTGYGTISSYKCILLFSVTDHTYVSNPLMCATMITDANTHNGYAQGYCIASRATELPILHYTNNNSLYSYTPCDSDNDCSYAYSGYTNYTISGSCMCTEFQSTSASYCKYGGGEADIIAGVAYYQKYWIPQYGVWANGHSYKYAYALDSEARVKLINPSFCTIGAFWNNMTVEPQSTVSSIIFYVIVGVLFLVGLAGIIVVFMMC